ncbi:MAG TPA: hypothetical protein VJ022_06860 [Anaerolineales bacterium]|nr:hypothetical protein [Anaerolineales bacterium]
MELDPKDNEIVKLLTKLKKADEAYPLEMLASRRQKYIRRVAEIGVGLGVSAGLRHTIKSGRSGAFAPTAGGLLEAALVIAIVAEASLATYFYRDKIADLIRSYSSTPQVEDVTSPPTISSPLPEFNATDIPETAETSTPTETPTGTPILAETTNDVVNDIVDDTNNVNNQAVYTPNPIGNNGNHFGQTPKPERIKDNGNNNSGDNGGGNGNGNDKDNGNGKDK